MITLEQVKKAAFGFGFSVKHNTETNFFTISGSLFALEFDVDANQIRLNTKKSIAVGDEELMEELSEIRAVRDELNTLINTQ